MMQQERKASLDGATTTDRKCRQSLKTRKAFVDSQVISIKDLRTRINIEEQAVEFVDSIHLIYSREELTEEFLLMESMGGEDLDKALVLLDQPQGEIIGMNVMSITQEQVDLDVDVELDNPSSLALHLVDIDFLFEDATHDGEEKKIIVRKVPHACQVQPHTSEIIRVPLQFAYRDTTPANSTSEVGHAGRIIPFRMRGNLNCWNAFGGVFQIAIARLKQFLTIVDNRLGVGRLRSFNHPTGSINGMHFIGLSPSEAKMGLEVRVRNSNPVPIMLVYTSFVLESDSKKTLVSGRMENDISLRGNSSQRVVIPVTVPLTDVLQLEDDQIRPGSVVPYTLKVEFWFRQNFYGMYKVSAERQGELPIPLQPQIKIHKVIFGYDQEHHPVAKLVLKLVNKNQFPLKLTKFEYEIRSVDGTSVATISTGITDERPLEVEVGDNGEITLEVVAAELGASFGSALWDAFSEEHSRYKVHSLLEAETAKFGKMTFPSWQ